MRSSIFLLPVCIFLFFNVSNKSYAEDLSTHECLQNASTSGKPTLTITLDFSNFTTRAGVCGCFNFQSQAWCSCQTSDNNNSFSWYLITVKVANGFSVEEYPHSWDCATLSQFGTGYYFILGGEDYSEMIPFVPHEGSYIDSSELSITPASIYDQYDVVWVSRSLPIQ